MIKELRNRKEFMLELASKVFASYVIIGPRLFVGTNLSGITGLVTGFFLEVYGNI